MLLEYTIYTGYIRIKSLVFRSVLPMISISRCFVLGQQKACLNLHMCTSKTSLVFWSPFSKHLGA